MQSAMAASKIAHTCNSGIGGARALCVNARHAFVRVRTRNHAVIQQTFQRWAPAPKACAIGAFGAQVSGLMRASFQRPAKAKEPPEG